MLCVIISQIYFDLFSSVVMVPVLSCVQSNSPGCEAGCWPALMGKLQDWFLPTTSRSLERGEVVNTQRRRSSLRPSGMTRRPSRDILLQSLSHNSPKTSAQASASAPLQPPQRSCWKRCMQKPPSSGPTTLTCDACEQMNE